LFEKTTPGQERNGGQLGVWSLSNKSMRVGYIGESLYMINTDFAHFIKPNEAGSGTYVMIDDVLKNN
jgi:hypothetical protein